MRDKVYEACEKLLHMFETGEMPPAIARTVIEASKYDKPSNRWSLGNQLIMWLHGTSDARGYRQWQEVNRNIKKGAKAFYILAPIHKKVKVKEIRVIDGEEKEVEVEKLILVGFKEVPVFRYEDTVGEPLPGVDYAPKALPPLMDVARKFGIKVEYMPCLDRFYGSYIPQTDSIMLCSHDVITFFHELAHAVHHRIKPLKPGQDPEQEIIAETVAAVLCELYSYSGYIPVAYEYIRTYAATHDRMQVVKKIMGLLADIQKIIEIILTDAEEEKKEAVV